VNWQTPGASGANDRENADIGSIQILANEPLNTEKQIALAPAKIQELVSGAFTNNGFIVVADTELNDRFNYRTSDHGTASQRPKLVVQYTLPPITSTPTSTATAAFTPTATHTPTATPSPTHTSTPTATATGVSGGFPATGLLDDFNRADGPIGSSWSGWPQNYDIVSNRLAVGSSGTETSIYWNPSRFGVDQEVFVTLTNIDPNGGEQDLLLKSQSATTWGYGVLEVMYDAANQRVYVVTWEWPQGWIQHGAYIPVTFSNGDQFGARATADGTVEVYKNGTLVGTRDITSWTHYAEDGFIGLWFIDAEDAVLDDFGGGTVPGGEGLMMGSGETSSKGIEAGQLDVQVNAPAVFWQGVPIGAEKEAYITFTDVNPLGKEAASLKPQSNGVWGDDTVEVLYDVVGGRIQVWMYDAEQGWVQYGKDIPVKFSAGDQFSVQVLADGTVQIYRSGKLLAKLDVIP